MTIANEITRINNAKAAIKQAIQNKGVAVSDNAKIDDYPALIDSITVGSGEGDVETYEKPNFFDLRTKGGINYHGLFYHYAYVANSYSLDLSDWNTSKATDMSHLFYYCNTLASVNLDNWDTSNVKSMNHMFYYCQELTELNIKHFDVSKVNVMESMFANCKKLKNLDLSGWKPGTNTGTSVLNSFNSMFSECNSLESVNITGWDTSKIANMNYMFNNCNKLVEIIGEIDASSLSNGFYPGSSSNPFYKCASLEKVYIKNIYKNIDVSNASKFSINLSPTKVKDECLIYIINELPDLINDKGLTATDKIILTLPITNTLTAEQVQPAIDKAWTVANTTY